MLSVVVATFTPATCPALMRLRECLLGETSNRLVNDSFMQCPILMKKAGGKCCHAAMVNCLESVGCEVVVCRLQAVQLLWHCSATTGVDGSAITYI
jgi:hypothetical protein